MVVTDPVMIVMVVAEDTVMTGTLQEGVSVSTAGSKAKVALMGLVLAVVLRGVTVDVTVDVMAGVIAADLILA